MPFRIFRNNVLKGVDFDTSSMDFFPIFAGMFDPGFIR
jgi:hypothetical protein